MSGDWIGDHFAWEGIDLLDQFFGKHLVRGASGDNLSVFHNDKMGGISCCLVEIMQHRNQGASSSAEFAAQLQ